LSIVLVKRDGDYDDDFNSVSHASISEDIQVSLRHQLCGLWYPKFLTRTINY